MNKPSKKLTKKDRSLQLMNKNLYKQMKIPRSKKATQLEAKCRQHKLPSCSNKLRNYRKKNFNLKKRRKNLKKK